MPIPTPCVSHPARRGSVLLLTAALLLIVAPLCRAADTGSPVVARPAAPTITLDTSQLDALHTFGVKGKQVADDWYPRIVQILGAEKSVPPAMVAILMDLNNDGVAGTSGTQISVSAKYALKHPDDFGMIVHELTHVVQAYPKYDPVWLVEGIADYVRWFNYEPESARPHPNPAKAHYNDSYRTTASFLDYVTKKYDPELVKKLDAALKSDTYSEEIFKKSTGGKSLDELNTEWLASLKP